MAKEIKVINMSGEWVIDDQGSETRWRVEDFLQEGWEPINVLSNGGAFYIALKR